MKYFSICAGHCSGESVLNFGHNTAYAPGLLWIMQWVNIVFQSDQNGDILEER